MKRILYSLAWVVGVAVVVVLQASVIGTNPTLQLILFLPVVFGCALVVFGQPTAGIVASGVSAYLLDVHSRLPFGVIFCATVVAVLACALLRASVFKHKALYAFVLSTMAGTIVYHVIFSVLVGVLHGVGITEFTAPFTGQLPALFWQVVVHALCIMLVFAAGRQLDKRFWH